MSRRVTTHNARTYDNELLTVITIWEENTGKQQIRKQLPYCKTQEILVQYGNKFEFIRKQA